MRYVDTRASEYPAQQWARIGEAALMLGLIEDFDPRSCNQLWDRLQAQVAAGRVKRLATPDGDRYQLVKGWAGTPPNTGAWTIRPRDPDEALLTEQRSDGWYWRVGRPGTA